MSNRKQHWQTIYQDKSPLDVSWYQKEPKLSLELILSTGISTHESIIDVGGGSSCLVDYLHQQGFTNLSVLDISANALASSQKRLGVVASQINWYETDITEFIPQQTFSVWHDRAVFHFLTDQEDRKNYVKVLQQTLRPGGHLIMAAFAIGGPEQCSGLDIVQYDSAKLIAELTEDFEIVEQRQELHTTPAGKQQKFNYFRFKKTGE